MSPSNQNKYTVSLFGDGADNTVGVIIEGIPIGFVPDSARLKAVCGEHKILSGLHGGKCSGTPLCAILPTPALPKLQDVVSGDVIRPGMGDLGEYKKSMGRLHCRGGYHSVVNTEPALLFAGELARQLLHDKKLELFSHIYRLGEVTDEGFDSLADINSCREILQKGELPTLDKRKEMLMKLAISKAQADKDTLGGQIEAAITGLGAGWGDPVFAGLKSQLSEILFALPDVMAVEFGVGTRAAEFTGSEFNDTPYMDTTSGSIKTNTNHRGGIEGNMSNGMPILLKVTFAPSPVIGKPQATVHRSEQRNVTLPPFEVTQTSRMKEMCQLVQAALAITIIDILL